MRTTAEAPGPGRINHLDDYSCYSAEDTTGAGEMSLIEGSIPEAEEAVLTTPQMMQNEITTVLAEYQSVLSPSVRYSSPHIPPVPLSASISVNLPENTSR